VLADAIVERRDPSTVTVRWSWSGQGRSPVTVIASTSLRGDDQGVGDEGLAGKEITAAAGPHADQLILRVPANPRHLFVVRAEGGPGLVVAERRVALKGTLNFRDLGGYRGVDGRRVRWGHVYRSDNLASVDADGWASIAELGVRSVYDLRHEAERDRAPSHVPSDVGIAHRHLPIGGEAAEAPDLVELLRQDTGRYGLEFMIDMNRTLLRAHAAVFGTLITDLADKDHLPAIFHCTAGKDRTGTAAALLLSALGVSRETVLDDYELTTVYRSVHRIEQLRPTLEEAGIEVEQVRTFLSAPRPALATALEELDRDHGTVARYLTDAAGVAPDTLVQLRDLLLTSH
jgi:protein-tyrosine phosphatase